MIYIHIPFCRSFCTYCDFYSEVVRECAGTGISAREEILYAGFGKALTAEILSRKQEFTGGLNTLYIGGGTPSVLPLSFFESIVGTLRKAGVSDDYAEFTVEVNPEDVVCKGVGWVRGLKDLGVTRISMGVQSFDDSVLRWMNRRHSVSTAREAYSVIESAGIDNISIDLIFGLPQVSDTMWADTVDSALAISASGSYPPHISAYQLSVEPGSALAGLMRNGKFEEADEALCSRQYSILCSKLAAAGYHHYEISNFALPKREAVHNSAYWRHVPYSGFGPGAHSFLKDTNGRTIRKWNRQDLKSYIQASGCGFKGVVEYEELTQEQLAMEEIMLSLRTDEGIDLKILRELSGTVTTEQMLEQGNLVLTGNGKVRIPEDKFFISDNIIGQLV